MPPPRLFVRGAFGGTTLVGRFIFYEITYMEDNEDGVELEVTRGFYFFCCFLRKRDPHLTLHIPCTARRVPCTARDVPYPTTELTLEINRDEMLKVETDFGIGRIFCSPDWVELTVTPVVHMNINNTLKRVYVKSLDADCRMQLAARGHKVVYTPLPKAEKPMKFETVKTEEENKFEAAFNAMPVRGAKAVDGVALVPSGSETESSEDGDAELELAINGEPKVSETKGKKRELDAAAKKAGPVAKAKKVAKAQPVPKSDPLKPPAPDPPVPPPPPVLDPKHPYFWITRTNKRAACGNPTCELTDHNGKIGRVAARLERVLYHPDPAMVQDKREWGKVWWKYYHVIDIPNPYHVKLAHRHSLTFTI